ncbi:ATP-binding protein [Candidatus Phyllobacterium onerii]|uniref:ATP-binding protein n=1 Tax=Candidatus Phyllobacterium onerii TaxID=3020828 RepID=UPI002330E7F3|nr:ATP-binding protein [Phyllobacterium sp. IY22]
MTRVKALGRPVKSSSSMPSEASATPLDDFSDDDFFDSIITKLPAKSRETIEIISKVKSTYITSGRDAVLKNSFDDFLEKMFARRNGLRDDGRAFFVTGASGAGKTYSIEHLLAENETMQPQVKSFGTIKPVISVALLGPSTLKILGRSILRQAGYELVQNMEQGEIWDMLPAQLHHRKVLIIHVDETQHMLKQTKTDTERENLAKAFKGVMNYKPWPVSFIMSGMPETTELARLDEQIERRGYYIDLPDIELPESRALVLKIINKSAEAAGLQADKVVNSDLPERITHAARYRFGRITQVMLEAIQVALKRGDPHLSREHFAYAYLGLSHARGHDEMNPFLVDDWERLPPGSFLKKWRDD